MELFSSSSCLQGIYRAYLEKLHPDTSPNENNHEEQEDITSKQDKDNSDSLTESKMDVSIGQKDASHPRTTKEVFEQHKLVFYDVNTVSCLSASIIFNHQRENVSGPIFVKTVLKL